MAMVHLRIVVPSFQSEHVLDLLTHTPSVCNLIFLERAAQDGGVLPPVGHVPARVCTCDRRNV